MFTAGVCMADLVRILKEKSRTFLDGSTLGKMRDSYPLDLFTLQRAFDIRTNGGNEDAFLYVFIFGLWAEAVENRKFNIQTRMVILETLLLFFMTLGKIMEGSPMAQNKRRDVSAVTFVSRKKVFRCACTLSAQLAALSSQCKHLGLDRIGSHTEENYIGNIRRICHGDNRAGTVKHQVARFELARHLLTHFSIERQVAKRVNLGGVDLDDVPASEFCYDGTPSDFAWELLILAGVPNDAVAACGILADRRDCPSFIEMTMELSRESPLNPGIASVRDSTQGCQIISRLHEFGSLKKKEEEIGESEVDTALGERRDLPVAPRVRKVGWSAEENMAMKAAIMEQKSKKEMWRLFPDKSDMAVKAHRVRMLIELDQRDWTKEEDEILLGMMMKGETDIERKAKCLLVGRSKGAIRRRMEALSVKFGCGSGWGATHGMFPVDRGGPWGPFGGPGRPWGVMNGPGQPPRVSRVGDWGAGPPPPVGGAGPWWGAMNGPGQPGLSGFMDGR
jgi:hypothetical protein